MERQRYISGGSIISREGRVLLVRHQYVGHWDFFVLPGGRAVENESAESAAVRETTEEAGLRTEVIRLAYVEDMQTKEMRECKLWFFCRDLGGAPSAEAIEATREKIISAAFYSRAELDGKTVFPPMLTTDEFWVRLAKGFPSAEYLGLRNREY
jgi:8-oxo-dGTP diphosphatase